MYDSGPNRWRATFLIASNRLVIAPANVERAIQINNTQSSTKLEKERGTGFTDVNIYI